MITPQEEDRLLASAIALAMDVREDLAAAHRTVAYLQPLELQQLTIALAAMVDPNLSLNVTAWWRVYASEAA